MERERKLLDIIKKKPYQSFDYHPRMFETMANGKKMQLVTASKLPQLLRKTPLKLRHAMG